MIRPTILGAAMLAVLLVGCVPPASPDAPEGDPAPQGKPAAAFAWTSGLPAPLVSGFTLVGENAQGYPEYDKDLDSGVTMRFVLVPAGSFTMGSSENEEFHGPLHKVLLDAFLIAKTECTQRQWLAVMGNNPAEFTEAGLDAPVDSVSWNDIQIFENETGLELPSEAQWEYVAVAETPTASTGRLSSAAWHGNNSKLTTHPVATRAANDLGVHDMLGNVWEWCEDTWHENLAGAPADGRAWIQTGSHHRILRGGSYSVGAIMYRPVLRGLFPQARRNRNHGFRAAKSLR